MIKTDSATQQKKVDTWSDNLEELIKDWGEKAAGLKYLHTHSGREWKKTANYLTVSAIIISSIASTVSLIATNFHDEDVKNGLLFFISGIGFFNSIIQSFKKLYNAEEKSTLHFNVAKHYGFYYRYINLQLNISRDEREPAYILTNYALKEYERLQLDAPTICAKSITEFKNKFKNNNQAMPDIIDDKFVININRDNKAKKRDRSNINKLLLNKNGNLTMYNLERHSSHDTDTNTDKSSGKSSNSFNFSPKLKKLLTRWNHRRINVLSTNNDDISHSSNNGIMFKKIDTIENKIINDASDNKLKIYILDGENEAVEK